MLETELKPTALMRGLLGVERAMGREREGAVTKGPRVIDLDLLLYGDVVMATDELTLPHPEMHARRFVLEPLAGDCVAGVDASGTGYRGDAGAGGLARELWPDGRKQQPPLRRRLQLGLKWSACAWLIVGPAEAVSLSETN